MGEVTAFASFGGRAQGYLALPPAGHGPGVVLIQEWWGLVPHIEDVANRLALEGFVVLAPDFYRGESTREPDEAMKLMLGLRIRQAAEDIAGAAEYLLTRDDVDGEQISAIGFCMGGGLALLAPTTYRAIDTTVAFYPAMPWPDFTPDWSAYRGKIALVHLAEHDDPGSHAATEAYAVEITRAGGEAIVEKYAGSQHAFFNDTRPEVYDANASTVAWDRSIALLRRRAGLPAESPA